MSIELTIDGRKVRGSPDKTILDVAKENGVHIPTLCNHPRLRATGACRICVVDIGRPDRLEAACTTLVYAGMVVNTASERVVRVRRTNLELILSNITGAGAVNKYGVNVLLDLSRELGVDTDKLRFAPPEGDAISRPVDAGNPVIMRDRDKCILCGRCVSACNELHRYGVLNFEGRGFHTNIVSGLAQPLLDSGCASCGECVEVCPTGAFRTLARELVQGEIDAVIETGLAFPMSMTAKSARDKLALPPLDNSGAEDLVKIAWKTKLRCKPAAGGSQ